jgi:hypothetical protein
MFYLIGGGDSGMSGFIRRRQPSVFCQRMRRQWRGLGARGQRGRTGGYAKGEFQKVAAFHDSPPSRGIE